jgi:hypothetical protein
MEGLWQGFLGCRSALHVVFVLDLLFLAACPGFPGRERVEGECIYQFKLHHSTSKAQVKLT